MAGRQRAAVQESWKRCCPPASLHFSTSRCWFQTGKPSAGVSGWPLSAAGLHWKRRAKDTLEADWLVRELSWWCCVFFTGLKTKQKTRTTRCPLKGFYLISSMQRVSFCTVLWKSSGRKPVFCCVVRKFLSVLWICRSSSPAWGVMGLFYCCFFAYFFQNIFFSPKYPTIQQYWHKGHVCCVW